MVFEYRMPVSSLATSLNSSIAALSLLVAALNLIVAISLAYFMIRGNRTGRIFKIALIVLNLSSCLLQLMTFNRLYDILPPSLGRLFPPFAAFIFGGTFWLLLEIRFVFGTLFLLGPVDKPYWTLKRKVVARIALIAVHFLLLWPAYLGFSNDRHIRYWAIIGQATHAALCTIISFLQAYFITSRLFRYRKTEFAPSRVLHKRQIILVMLLIMTFLMNMAGILSYTWGSSIRGDLTNSNWLVGRLTEQFAASCLGNDVLSETISLLVMVNLVLTKSAAVTPTKDFEKPITMIRSVDAPIPPDAILLYTFPSVMFKERSNDRPSDDNSTEGTFSISESGTSSNVRDWGDKT
ncbi:hypothetical protein BASA50_000663 [Batrachochytrium salamandrivorans]|uniref:G-protein coupled receptors family 1 profile domain-containing protein n=1 Tax=Batrachochytrium salamandrivorans TaxID=1357716 RepID=A0ABQ8EWA1_9FUNG|nr:hypothetical protein BASA62_004916 [Batrachochytrium salamandrivorans]KAH6573149.1 hypothetical protein BASA60_006163 [Batrachochytrium salamandrivorans]KAH6579611.1 hypothetical protein BASA61_010127 [Batrachochytrium salamandrivorans]KAH6586198.1 hypothetical protein BASA50_000663 [Batrachochytrium salamandrivorans]KAH9245887.1 hypothetical protein BASA81_016589 [Batrachochytrium salamandrivorans]